LKFVRRLLGALTGLLVLAVIGTVTGFGFEAVPATAPVVVAHAAASASPTPAAVVPVVTDRSGIVPAAAIIKPPCKNRLVRILHDVGFRGENVREAWAIAMRETGGRPEVGPGHPDFNGADVGLFQFNQPSYEGKWWWDTEKLVNGHYNATVAFIISDGGKTWYPWGLDGKGRTNDRVYRKIWSKAKIASHITEPYRYWYGQFPC